MKRLFLFVGCLALTHEAAATWSVLAVDRQSGAMVIASATCVAQARFATFPAEGLMDIQAIVVPGRGIAAAQAGVDRTRANQNLIREELEHNTSPADIIDKLRLDPAIESRQFAIIDAGGKSAGYSGTDNGPVALDVDGRVSDITYSIQGNLLANEQVVRAAASAFKSATGTLSDRAMAAMEAADAAGGDRRCDCSTLPMSAAPCTAKTAHVAYLLATASDDPAAEPAIYLNVTDENIQAGEDANPVKTLRLRYDALEPKPEVP